MYGCWFAAGEFGGAGNGVGGCVLFLPVKKPNFVFLQEKICETIKRKRG
jgi:hypothetical protein